MCLSWRSLRTLCLAAVAVGAALCNGLPFDAAPRVQAQEGARQKPPKNVNVLIAYRTRPDAGDRKAIRDRGGSVKRSFLIVPAVAATLPEPEVAALRKSPRVAVVEPDGEFHLVGEPQPQSAAASAELDGTWGIKHIRCGTVHDGAFSGGELLRPARLGNAVRVAILDTGIDDTHPDLLVAGGYDFHNRDDDPWDDHGHGTHVAGTVAALRNQWGVVGAAPRVELYALKVLGGNGSGSFSSVISALEWCVLNGIHVANHSYGSSTDPGTIVRNAFDNAWAMGVLHVASAGNSGSSSGKGDSVGYPAKYGSVIAVAATDQQNQRAWWSSTGPDVELSAPGVSITSTVPGGEFATWSGTSMASPHAAGVAALVFAAGVPDGNGNGRVNDEVRDLLAMTAVHLGSSSYYGYGLVDALDATLLAESLGGSTDDGQPGNEEEDPPSDGGPGGGDDGPGAGEPSNPRMTVTAIVYKASKKELKITVSVRGVDDGSPIVGAAVSITLYRDGGNGLSGTGTTAKKGDVTFVLKNPPAGTYTTVVQDVVRDGWDWDGQTPQNAHKR